MPTSNYRTIKGSFWTDPALAGIGPDALLLFNYLISNPHTHVSGIYYLPRQFQETETQLPPARWNAARMALSSNGHGQISWDDKRQVVFVRTMFRHQAGHDPAPTLVETAFRQILSLHGTPLVDEFLDRYGHLELNQRDRRGHVLRDDHGSPQRESLKIALDREIAVRPPQPGQQLTLVGVAPPSTPVEPGPDNPRAEAQKLANLWNTITTRLSKVRDLNNLRIAHANARLNEFGPDVLGKAFQRLDESNFATGNNDRDWRASFDWIISSKGKVDKVLEGNYDNRVTPRQSASTQHDLDRLKRAAERDQQRSASADDGGPLQGEPFAIEHKP